MSTFSGLLREIPHISVDCFDGVNSNSQLFFLSHCHMDHLKGIASLKKTLYTSHISSVIVRKKFPHIADIVPLEFGVPTALKYRDPRNDRELTVVVTALPAGHMPGSIMLHFQTADQSVIYTGDFRLRRSDLERIKPLKLISDARSCDAVYVDSTFFSEQWPEFPPQQASIEKIVELIRSWVEKSRKHVVELKTPATYGSELLFRRIYQELGLKIHVSANVFEQYQYVPDLDGVATTNPSGLQIHACFGEDKKVCLENPRKSGLVRVIRPSALIWRYWRTGKDIVQIDTGRAETYRVCYSNHASLCEVKDLLLFLKAKKVYLNVENPERAEKMKALLLNIMKEYNGEAAQELGFCPFGSHNGDGFQFSNAQPLAIGRDVNLPIDEEFVVALPKRRRRISATTS